MPLALLTDLYELNMAAAYLRQGMTGVATFSLFVRELPASRGFLVAAGLEDALSYLERLAFEDGDLEYLAGIGFSEESLDAFAKLRFEGEVWAVPEGTVVLAGEPLLEVSAPLPVAQLVETYLLNTFTIQTALATKAARCRLAAGERISLVDFSLRRTQGMDAGLAVARLSAMCGFVGTSNVEAARRFGLTPSGTMAHSYVVAFEDELEAFVSFGRSHPGRVTFLVDTYDPKSGIDHAIEAIRRLGLERRAGVRIDSGDLGALAREARRRLDEAGLPLVQIFVSGGLDERDLRRFVEEGAPIDAAGVGTKLGVVADAPYLDTVYKLVEYAGRPVAKLSEGKETLPGSKQVFRAAGLLDVIGCRDEVAAPGQVALLEPVMREGRRTRPGDDLGALRERVEAGLASLPEGVRDLDRPVAVVPGTSERLRRLTREVWDAART
jgi:nicotinate phosphoribosyltransferase